mmetsp:Transcript_1351/g.857  ORF Transcript_1351/g.857 Transcript_1351/m.857 type:complete len:166 (-) Transcript_1351:131-628(-)
MKHLHGLKVEGHVCDVDKKEQRLKLFKLIEEKHGRLDVLVLNAACSTHFGTQLDIDEKAYDKMFSLNVTSYFFSVKEAKHLLEKGKGANVLMVSSVAGSDPSPMLGVYGMTKSCLNNMVRWLSKELLDENIRVNAISPGLIKTEFAGVLWKENEELNKKSLGTPE